MAERLLRIKLENCGPGMPYELLPRRIDVIKNSNAEYIAKYTKMNEINKKVTVKNKMTASDVDGIMKELSIIHIQAFPNHLMGCDGGFTELEVGGYSGKSHFRWWSGAPDGWEKLDDIVERVIRCSGIEDA
jgi:hypothetical protein|tara:strand:+ start:75 stop:467 length:393 start_codon:yes stop_codon:yes gene_type:complete